MSTILSEKPNAEPVPRVTSASIILDGRYLPPPEDKDGKLWVRKNSLVQANSQELYSLWRSVERAPEWQEQIVSVSVKGLTISHWVMLSPHFAVYKQYGLVQIAG